ncbi:MAG: hypothetical protein QQN41_09040 [Nitrosopumilus sp.]
METLKSMLKDDKEYDEIVKELVSQQENEDNTKDHEIIAEFFGIDNQDVIEFVDAHLKSYSLMRGDYDYFMNTPLKDLVSPDRSWS